MVEEQLAARDIVDRRVLDAMGRVPREAFVGENDLKHAYLDMPLRIGFGQTISQPYMVAIICQTADVHEGDRVLDIGTGSGYQAAVLKELGGEVHTIERIPEDPKRRGRMKARPSDSSPIPYRTGRSSRNTSDGGPRAIVTYWQATWRFERRS